MLAALAAGARREDLGKFAAVLQFAFEPSGVVIYRVTILDGYNLPLTRIWNVPSTCLGSR